MRRRCGGCFDARIKKTESVWAIYEMYSDVDMVRNKIKGALTHMRAIGMSSVSGWANANLMREFMKNPSLSRTETVPISFFGVASS